MSRKHKQTIHIPLLKDHHNHLTFYSLLHDCLNIQDIREKAAAMEKLKQLELPRHQDVNVVLGWNSSHYTFMEAELKELPPIIIVNVSLHSFLITQSAEKKLRDKYPDIIENYKNPKWYEDNMPKLLIFLANQVEPTEEKIRHFYEYLHKKGVYYVEDMLLTGEKVLSIVMNSPFAERTAFWADLETYRELSPAARKHVKGIKLFTDGALGAATAALRKTFKNGEHGYLLLSDEALISQVQEVADQGQALSIHAIGDDATEQVVRVLSKTAGRRHEMPEIRIEHVQFIDKTVAMEAKEMGIILSMQPNFCMDSVMYLDRLPGGYAETNNPFRMLVDEIGFEPGRDLILGSDGMPQGAETALQYSLFPPIPGQRLTMDEFVAGYCMPDKSTGQLEIEINQDSLQVNLR